MSTATTSITLAYKVKTGAYWHLELVGRRRSGYVITSCRRRLGRWHVLPAKSLRDVPKDLMCAACARKLAEGDAT